MTDTPLVLDFDGSVTELPQAHVVALTHWQQRVRFGCSMRTFAQLRQELARHLPAQTGPVFTGSGDFHHVSLLLIERLAHAGPLDVVVFDNHPDNMLYPWGIHCGSWVSHVARLPFVRSVQVMGITSADVAWTHAWENRLRTLWQGKVRYWCVGVDTGWAAHLGLGDAIRSFDTSESMLTAFAEQQRESKFPVYLSIDKDVFSPVVARTNWDQGHMGEAQISTATALIQPRLIGCDVTGDVSVVRYDSAWKRLLSFIDGQPQPAKRELTSWQAMHHALNARLVRMLAGA